MPKRTVLTTLPVDGVFRFMAILREEGNKGLRVAIPAAIVRGLVHTQWTGRWLTVTANAMQFKAAVRAHPTSVMFALPKRCRGGLKAGDQVNLIVQKADGPKAPQQRRVRGRWQKALPSIALAWLGGR